MLFLLTVPFLIIPFPQSIPMHYFIQLRLQILHRIVLSRLASDAPCVPARRRSTLDAALLPRPRAAPLRRSMPDARRRPGRSLMGNAGQEDSAAAEKNLPRTSTGNAKQHLGGGAADMGPGWEGGGGGDARKERGRGGWRESGRRDVWAVGNAGEADADTAARPQRRSGFEFKAGPAWWDVWRIPGVVVRIPDVGKEAGAGTRNRGGGGTCGRWEGADDAREDRAQMAPYDLERRAHHPHISLVARGFAFATRHTLSGRSSRASSAPPPHGHSPPFSLLHVPPASAPSSHRRALPGDVIARFGLAAGHSRSRCAHLARSRGAPRMRSPKPSSSPELHAAHNISPSGSSCASWPRTLAALIVVLTARTIPSLVAVLSKALIFLATRVGRASSSRVILFAARPHDTRATASRSRALVVPVVVIVLVAGWSTRPQSRLHLLSIPIAKPAERGYGRTDAATRRNGDAAARGRRRLRRRGNDTETKEELRWEGCRCRRVRRRGRRWGGARWLPRRAGAARASSEHQAKNRAGEKAKGCISLGVYAAVVIQAVGVLRVAWAAVGVPLRREVGEGDEGDDDMLDGAMRIRTHNADLADVAPACWEQVPVVMGPEEVGVVCECDQGGGLRMRRVASWMSFARLVRTFPRCRWRSRWVSRMEILALFPSMRVSADGSVHPFSPPPQSPTRFLLSQVITSADWIPRLGTRYFAISPMASARHARAAATAAPPNTPVTQIPATAFGVLNNFLGVEVHGYSTN
ncbi:hypothetical protein B0H16DRAFT_1743734 [Mycena metata]|uniref:Uncharacterized protein n=1 Tax=Mycena metata TaxID=1033252 RepID=A0AAD7MDX1_9AGAR|nr:hypothetical protein B0H16DRAFT_1743734 [Mycena metata]